MDPIKIVTVIPDDFPICYGRPDHPTLLPLQAYGEVICFSTRYADRAEFFRRIVDAEAIINVRAYSTFDDEALAQAPRLKLISVQGVGTDNVDLQAATRRGVTVTNTPGVNSVSVAETALALMLDTVRGIALSDRRLRAGIWQHPASFELQGKTLGLLGLGAIGSHFARIAQGIGMKVVAWSWTADPERAARLGVELVERDDLFRRSDVVSIHLLNTPEARGSVGQRELGLMQRHAVLINTSRAPILDQEALVEALRAGRIGGAGLDVYLTEPLPLEQNPFKDLDNVVMTPHLGGVTNEASERSRSWPVDNIIGFLEGRPVPVVTG